MKAQYCETKIIDGVPKKLYRVIAHKFTMGDSEDPDLYAAEPLYNWEHSEAGQYVMSKAVEKPEWRRQTNFACFGYDYVITAKLYEEDATYYTLRWV